MTVPKESKSNKGGQAFLKYSGMAFQMGVIIAAGVLLGNWLDERAENETSWYTIGVGLFSIFAALYLMLKDLLKAK